jgi:MFS family permease
MALFQSAASKINSRNEINNLLLFSTGKLISIFGTSIYSFAMGLYVLNMTGSGLSFAATLVLGIIPAIIINPFAGVIADRFDKKKMVISMDLLNGIMLIAVFFLSSFYGLSIPVIYITTFMLTVFTTFFGVSLEAAKPNLVSLNRLMDINSISKIIDSFSSILGPMIGGMVFAFVDVKLFIIANGISFIFSAICEIFIDFKFNLGSPVLIRCL